MSEYSNSIKLYWYDIPCHVCGRERTNSWEKRCSRALRYKHIVCEECIAKEYDISVDELRSVMREQFGLIPCPGI